MTGELRRAAEQEVDKITAKVAVMRLTGEMKEVNRRYKNYRLAQVAMGKKAKPYSAAFYRRPRARRGGDGAGDLSAAAIFYRNSVDFYDDEFESAEIIPKSSFG